MKERIQTWIREQRRRTRWAKVELGLGLLLIIIGAMAHGQAGPNVGFGLLMIAAVLLVRGLLNWRTGHAVAQLDALLESHSETLTPDEKES